MAYARFGSAGSDVYVFLDVGGSLSCCGCWLSDDWHHSSTDSMLAHLDEHEAAGHAVPPGLREDLIEDRDANDAFIRWTAETGYLSCWTVPYGRRDEPSPDRPFPFEHYFTARGWRKRGAASPPMPGRSRARPREETG